MKTFLFKLNSVGDEIIPPISLGYLAAAAPTHDHVIVDGQKENLTDSQVIDWVKKSGAQVFGVQNFSKDLAQTRTLLRLMKQRLPEVVTVVGGTQPSVMPEKTLAFFDGAADFVFYGEAEIGFHKFLDALQEDGPGFDRKKIPGLVYQAAASIGGAPGGTIIVNQPEVIDALDLIPFPRWDLMPPASYPVAPHGAFVKQTPSAPIIASRGCPYPCTFCSAPALSGRKIRFRSLDNLFAEIKILVEEYGVRELHIEDDVFTLKKDYVLEFCDRLKKTGWGLTWALPNGLRLDSLTPDLIEAMIGAGCYAFNFGLESGSNETLKRIKKKLTVDDMREKLEMVRKYDVFIGGFFIIGFPWETADDIRATFEFARTLDIDQAGFSYFQPFPGTEAAMDLDGTGEYVIDLENFDTSLHTITFTPKGMTVDELRHLRNQGMRRYYLNPRRVMAILRRIQSPQHFYYIAKRGIRWLTK